MGIKVLEAEVVNQIAAGEVLERPANLLKELIENSLDAGATHLDIEFDRGGRDVVIRDDGAGIAAGDLGLALKPHATSKIVASGDLYHLSSFGFRGEALASIAAVSHLTLTSRQPNVETGARITSEFGKFSEIDTVAARPGTEVRVRDLFENVPARLRFLKSEASEATQIKNVLKALALAHEHVSFRVRYRGALLFHWPKCAEIKARAMSVLECGPLHHGLQTVDGVTAEVLVSSPEHTAKLNRNLWFFVQGRYVQDRALGAAVMEGYRNLLMHGEFPTAIVRLACAPEEVDVNVHPTKAQVKFREPSTAFRATCRAIRGVLEEASWLQDAPKAKPATESVRFIPDPPPTPNLRFDGPEFSRVQYNTKTFPLAEVRGAVASLHPPGTLSVTPTASAIAPGPAFRWADLQVIGQLNHTYIVAQTEEHMYLVDQHAAHERVVFERLMRDFRDGRIEVQNLLMPLVFDLSVEEVEALHAERASIERMGLSIERMGPDSIAAQAIPALVKENAISEGLRKVAFELVQNGGSLALDRIVGDIFATMACHSVIRAGQSQSVEQMRSLLRQMDEFALSSFCPHGRPVFTKRRFSDIEREFGRIN